MSYDAVAALLALLNVQLGLIVGWAMLERRSALRYRREALAVQDAQLDADLATWARIAGRQRPVFAGFGHQHEEPGHGEQSQEFTHRPMVQNGADV